MGRTDPAWYTPAPLPIELRRWTHPVQDSLGVGTAGKVGLLELTLARRHGTTRIREQFQQAPLYLYRSVHLDEARPDMAFIFVLQSGDGMVQGDRYRIDLHCERDAAVHVTTQAATKVFKAKHNFVSQLVNVRTAAGAVLEYLPEPIVPHRDARFFQRTCVTAHPDSTVIIGETLLPGRVAHDERHAYDLYRAELEVRDADQQLLFADVLHLSPVDGDQPHSVGRLADHEVVATLYVITRQSDPADLVALMRQAVAGCAEVFAGVSELPHGSGAVVRLLGPDSRTTKAALTVVWDAARRRLIGAAAPNLRRG